MTVLFALAAAALYGLADFVGGVASRKTSVYPVGLLACVGGTLGALVLAFVEPGHPGQADLLWGVVGGLGGGAGTAFLYRGLATGRMGVVAPVSAVGAVLVPLATAVGTGERPQAWSWIGIACAVPGIWLVSRDEAAAPSNDSGASALIDGILAGLGFGVSFAALGQVGDGAGYWPLVAMELIAVLAVAVSALVLGGDPRPRQWADLWGLAPGVMSALALLCFILANRHGLLSIAAVLTALYPAFTVILAIGVLRERVHRIQALGLLLCGATIVFVSLG